MGKSILNKDTAVWRGVRTAIQSVPGFITGLFTVVWAVPGVQEAVSDYLSDNLPGLIALFFVGVLPASVIAGVIAFVWNARRKDVKTL